MDDKQAMHAMSIDDAYHVERTLARGPSGVTELVSIDGNGPFVRKKIPSPLAQRNVWRRSAPARVIVCRVWKRRTSCPTGSSSSTITCRAARLGANCGGKRAACTECGRAAYRPNLRSRAGASPARRYPPRHHAGQRHRGPGWRASHRFRHRAHPVRGKQPFTGYHGAWHLRIRLA